MLYPTLQQGHVCGLDIERRSQSFLPFPDQNCRGSAVGSHFLLHLVNFPARAVLIGHSFLDEPVQFLSLVIQIFTGLLEVIAPVPDIRYRIEPAENRN